MKPSPYRTPSKSAPRRETTSVALRSSGSVKSISTMNRRSNFASLCTDVLGVICDFLPIESILSFALTSSAVEREVAFHYGEDHSKELVKPLWVEHCCLPPWSDAELKAAAAQSILPIALQSAESMAERWRRVDDTNTVHCVDRSVTVVRMWRLRMLLATRQPEAVTPSWRQFVCDPSVVPVVLSLESVIAVQKVPMPQRRSTAAGKQQSIAPSRSQKPPLIPPFMLRSAHGRRRLSTMQSPPTASKATCLYFAPREQCDIIEEEELPDNNKQKKWKTQRCLLPTLSVPVMKERIGVELLRHIILSPPLCITETPPQLFAELDSVFTIDLRPWTHLRIIWSKFAANCPQLTEVFLPSPSAADGCDGGLKKVGADFLRGAKITHFDMEPLQLLTELEDRFLYSCSKLTQISGIHKLTHLTAIQGSCFSHTGLTNFELEGPLPSLVSLGSDFLSAGRSLVAVYLNGMDLPLLKHIGNDFLSRSSVVSVTLTGPFQSLKAIGVNFLFQCKEMRAFDSTGLLGVHFIGVASYTRGAFMKECTNLTSVNLAGFALAGPAPVVHPKWTEGFLSFCSKLRSVDLQPVAQWVGSEVGDDFCSGLGLRSTPDFSPFGGVTGICGNFFAFCPGLTVVSVDGLSNVSNIQSGFFQCCLHLREVTLKGFTNLRRIGDKCFAECMHLQQVDFSGLTQVDEIGFGFFSHCRALPAADLSPLSNVKKVGDDFFAGCRSLTSIRLESLVSLSVIGHNFCGCCLKLREIEIPAFTSISHIGQDFLGQCGSLQTVDMSAFARFGGSPDPTWFSRCRTGLRLTNVPPTFHRVFNSRDDLEVSYTRPTSMNTSEQPVVLLSSSLREYNDNPAGTGRSSRTKKPSWQR